MTELSLPFLAPDRSSAVLSAVAALATATAEERGSIYTRREVVDFLLDLIGYTPDQPLAEYRLLEPSFGGGTFLFAAVERLLDSYVAHEGNIAEADTFLRDAIRAVEVHAVTYSEVSTALIHLLGDQGLTREHAIQLTHAWLVNDDFLLADLPETFTHVVGNPPYLRQDRIHPALIQEYRHRYRTIYDRADLYIPFIERSLELLAPSGKFGFICSDRWMKNRYGGPLRKMIAEGYHLQVYVDMVDTPAFENTVIAYPAVFVIAREQGRTTAIARRPQIAQDDLSILAQKLLSPASNGVVTHVDGVTINEEPWLFDDVEAVQVLRRLERDFPLLEDVGCLVGIGVATGADDVYIRPAEELPIEEDRRLPLAMSRDLRNGVFTWSGQYVLNPFTESGQLVDLESYPKLATYLQQHEERIRQRHVAKKSPAKWYRTIDRIYPALVQTPKLLIPDIKGQATVIFDTGEYYPHHNLYYVVSDSWDLQALQTVLQSSVAEFFVGMYSVKMQGGFLRFQAQYLRRIRLPEWSSISPLLQQALKNASTLARQEVDALVAELYGLSEREHQLIHRVDREVEAEP